MLFRSIPLFALLGLAISPLYLEAVTLQQVFEATPQLADFRPGPYVLHMSAEDATVRIEGKLWEIRYVTYSDIEGRARHRSLQQLANDYGFVHEEGRPFKTSPFLVTTTWMAPVHMKEEGIYYIVSIRPLESDMSLAWNDCEKD